MQTRQRLRRHVTVLAADIGERHVFRPSALAAAAEYIETTWRGQGHDVRRLSYEVRGAECSSLEITLRGRERPDRIVLAGAHYDTVQGSPGADDNASGVAALLELGRLLREAGPAPGTIRLVAFPNEEPPFFWWGSMGSMVYARDARRRGDDIRVMLSLEMLGYYRDERHSQRYPPLFRWFYPDRGNFIGLVSNLRSRHALGRATAALRAATRVPVERIATLGFVPGVSWSDHLSFWRQGYPALMVTDTAFYRNPNYHTARDTPDTLDYSRMADLTEGLAEVLRRLA